MLRDSIDDAISNNVKDDALLVLMSDCIILLAFLAEDARGFQRVYDRFDRARLIFDSLQMNLMCILEKELTIL